MAGLKCDKALGKDGITPEILKHGGEAIIEWKFFKCVETQVRTRSGRNSHSHLNTYFFRGLNVSVKSN